MEMVNNFCPGLSIELAILSLSFSVNFVEKKTMMSICHLKMFQRIVCVITS